jgi:hypothetical protein
MAILGGSVAGGISAMIGLQACYVVDIVTFCVSAGVVWWGIQGNYKVASDGSAMAGRNVFDSCYLATKQLVVYLTTCSFGLLVFLKGSAALIWGPEDIIGVEFATVRDADGNELEDRSSVRMGLLFSTIGLGTLVGPLVINYFTDANRPVTLQRACWIGLTVMTIGWYAISLADDSFGWFVSGTLFRTMGSGIVWVNSTLILQTLCDKEILGRVLALDYAMTAITEAVSSTSTGALLDDGFSKCDLALYGAFLGTVAVTLWGIYHAQSRGAANPKLNNYHQENKDLSVSSLDMGMDFPSADRSTSIAALEEGSVPATTFDQRFTIE